jgi:ribosomal protein L32
MTRAKGVYTKRSRQKRKKRAIGKKRKASQIERSSSIEAVVVVKVCKPTFFPKEKKIEE